MTGLMIIERPCQWTEHVQRPLKTQSVEQKLRRMHCVRSRSCGIEDKDAT